MLTLALLAALAADPTAARDPFTPYRAESVGCAEACTPLQLVPLEALRLQGSVSGVAAPRALFELPSGETAIARVGDGIGTSGGTIASIRGGVVVVVERWRDGLDRTFESRVELKARTAR